MPNYVYRGTDCPHEFEVHQSFSEDPLTECTVCGKPVRRVFQPAGIVFKGSGWYITDSRKGGKDSGDKSPATKTGTAESAPEKKADTTAAKEPATAGASKE